MAGVVWFTDSAEIGWCGVLAVSQWCILKTKQAGQGSQRSEAMQKGQAGCPGCPLGEHQCANYLAMVVALPKRLRNFSTRPPMLSTDFWVPV
jgi:hypothetical protein